MPVTPDKRALREAAEKIERAVDAYGAGDLTGSSRLFEEALKLMPDHARAQVYLNWVRDLSSGKKKLGGLDEETLQAISDTLAPEEEQTREKLAEPAPEPEPEPEPEPVSFALEAEPAGPDESPWDPVPLTPGPRKVDNAVQQVDEAWGAIGADLEQQQTLSSAPAPERTRKKTPPPPATLTPPATMTPPADRAKPPSSTLLGVVSPEHQSLLSPASPRELYDTTENTGSVTREWGRGTPTGTNLPPLDVPELTDEQIQELLALDGSPMALEVATAPPAKPRVELTTDLGLGPEIEPRTLEIEAEPTPEPHLNPLGHARVPLISQDGDATTPRGNARRRDATTPDADLGSSVGSFQTSEFDTMEQTPTRERGDLLRAVVEHNPGGGEEDLQLPPLEAPVRDDILGEGTNPTNPFIKRKMAEYSGYGTGSLPKVDDLPPAPGLSDTNRQPVVATLATIQDPLDRGDLPSALEAAEKFLTEQGGLDADTVQPHYWLFERVYESSLGPLTAVPKHGQAVPDLDPRSAFLLSRLDGMSTVEDLLDVSGMPRLEALRLLALLVRRGVVKL
jgi:hypothetical protein